MEVDDDPTVINGGEPVRARELYSLVQNSLSRLQDKIDNKFDQLDLKMEKMGEKFSLQQENMETKIYAHIDKVSSNSENEHVKLSSRMDDAETWINRFKGAIALIVASIGAGVPIVIHYLK